MTITLFANRHSVLDQNWLSNSADQYDQVEMTPVPGATSDHQIDVGQTDTNGAFTGCRC